MVVLVTTSSAPAPAAPTAAQLTQNITATWWYTVSGVLMFEVMVVGLLMMISANVLAEQVLLALLGVTGLLWCAATVQLLNEYRHRRTASGRSWTRLLVPIAASLAFAVVAGLATGTWLFVVMPIAQALVLRDWPAGVRLRITMAATALLILLAVVDASRGVTLDSGAPLLPVIFAVMLPVVSVTSLWWWDVLVRLDQARASEARLAATQERLRVATDVHDLQGHHLQVIALQLELAERLMPTDADAGMQQLALARASVDEARQGTRDLAMRFRSLPLNDELANAADLLRAAGLEVQAHIPASAAAAPASVLGPVIRETTTNVLRHGGGARVRLALTREPDAWRYMIANDDVAGVIPRGDGSGIEGIRRRVAEAGGTVDVSRDGGEFTLTVDVPVRAEAAR